jgi:glycosyltransferase involved in cell wall biosynthesis
MLHPNSREGLPQISVVIPVRDAASVLPRCLGAVRQSEGVVWECIVVDDCSVDASAQIARSQGVTVLQTGVSRLGPAYARNVGARAAVAPLLCFVDADVVVRPDTLAQLVALFEAEPELTAAFGSYDAEPEALDLFSQYRNLLHHWVHQRGHEAASTFWAGCGAIRRAAFLAHGGFDPTYSRPSIEDIELGYRLRASGARVRLAKHIQV